ncbi:serine protease [Candidatus Uhrbacteria bacterium]|nr:serine protease [Candidatus Uhrbacteria bacterium]
MTRRILYLVIVLSAGFLSGMLGALVRTQETDTSPGSNTILRQYSQKEYPLADISNVLSEISPRIVRVIELYQARVVPNVFGVVISSDGWILAPGNVKANGNAVLDNRNAVHEIKKIIYHPGLDVSFIRAAKLKSSPVELLDRSRLTDAIDGFILNGFSSISPLIITPAGYSFDRMTGAPLQVHELAKRFNYDQEFAQVNRSVFTRDGTLVGFTAPYGIIPISAVKDVLPQLFKNNTLTFPTLALTYRDLAWSIQTEDRKTHALIDKGALLTSAPRTQYRVSAPNGKTIRLNSDDVIMAVNGERLDRNRGLSDIVQQYRVGDRITLGVLPKGEKEEKEITVLLEAFK